jgi:hypothetical protein
LSFDPELPAAPDDAGVDDGFTLEELDQDGAIVESIAALYGDSRAGFLRTAVFGGAALLAGLATPPSAEGAINPRNDVLTLNFDLIFEHLQS